MNRILKAIGSSVLVALLVFSMSALSLTACGNGTTSGNTEYEPVEYTSVGDDGCTYHLKITKDSSRATFTPKAGDSYVLTITASDGTKVYSTGTVESYDGGVLTLKQKDSDTPFSITVANGKMTKIEGDIPTDTKATVDAPSTLSPEADGGDPNPTPGGSGPAALNGTWVTTLIDEDGIYEFYFIFNNGNFEWGGKSKGTYTTSGNILTMTPTLVCDGAAPPKWYTKAEYIAAGFDDADEAFRTQSTPYSINGNQLTLVGDGADIIFTKKN